MPFIASNGLTEEGTSKTVAVGGMPGGMNVHYHDVGTGEPVLFLHSYGPGTTAWITFHKTVSLLSQHFRCILMDLPNFSKTGPIVYREGVHAVQARTAVALLDALGIAQAHWVGNSQGGQSAMVAAISYPERVGKFVMGGSHIGTGGDRYLLANRPSEGSRATQRAIADPRHENIRDYLRVHIDDETLVTDELVDYIHRAYLVTGIHRGAPAIGEPAARLHTRPGRHPRAGPADPRAPRPDGAVRGLDRDPQPHRRLTPRTAQQLRALAAFREARRMVRACPRLSPRLLRRLRIAVRWPPGIFLPQKSHGRMSSRPVVSKSGTFRVAKRPPLTRAIAAIIPSGAVMGRPCRSATLMMSP
jgi:pimeloyl-ACP methyl ester carboxylesterase